MSLQVWFPFVDGTLKQQGLSDAVVTSGGTVNLTNVGKLGKCATFGSAAGGLTIPASTMTSFSECSVAFWLKINGWGSSYDTYFQAGTGSASWNNYIFGFLRNNTNSTICFTISNGSSASNASYLTSALSTGIWYHVTLTYEAGKCKIYLDGNLDHEYNTSIVPAFNKITKITLGRCNNDSSYQTQCSMNDFRIYDHCLSPQEVKQISKGLLLHYLLNRNGFGCENLYGYGSDLQTSLSGLNNTGNGFSIVTEDGVKCAHATGALTTTRYLHSKVFFTPKPNEVFTFSAWIKIKNIVRGTTNPMCEFYFSGQTIDGSWKGVKAYLKFTVDGQDVPTSSIGFDNTKSFNLNNAGWHYVTATIRYADANFTTNLTGAIYLRDCTGDLYIHHVKLERGANATPWCPAAGDDLYNAMGLNSLIEYDVSGFGYNGTHIGNLTWSNDSPKYSASTVFDGASYIVTTPEWMTQGAKEYTISIWAYMDDWTNYPGRMYSCIQTGGFCDEKSGNNLQWAIHTYSNAEQTTAAYTSGTYCTYPFASITPGWHMFTWTYTTSVIKGYIDGEVVSTKTITTYGIHFNTNALLALGAESGGATITSPYFTGKLSDFRLYATALSANDVKSLYQNSAYIDSNGIIHGAIR